MNRALVVVDYQVDFVEPSGALYVPGAEELGPKIDVLAELYPLVILTQDWHVPADISFKEYGGAWPPHCVAGTHGAKISNRIPRADDLAMAIFRKRVNSAFTDALDTWLWEQGVTTIDLCGVALDFCVRETALDLAHAGWDVGIILPATRAVTPDGWAKATEELEAAEVRLVRPS